MRKLALFAAGFAAATCVCVYLTSGIFWLLAALCAVLTGFLALFRGKTRWLTVILLGAAFGALWCSAYTAFVLSPARSFCGENRAFTAISVSYSEPSGYGTRVEAKLFLRGKDVRAVLYLSEVPEQIAPGDKLTGAGDFTFTPEEGDLYHPADGVFLKGRVKDLLVQKPARIGLQPAMTRLSHGLRQRLGEVFPASSAGYFSALVTGDRSGLSYAFLNDMSLCGLYHSVSLSGMHVSVLMAGILFLLGGRRRLALFLGVPLLILFLMLSGMRPSTVRAVCMQTLLLLAAFSRREYDPPTSLCAALLVLLLEDPWCIAQWGLQLSFLSTAGILFLCPVILRRASRLKCKSKLLKKAYLGLMGSFAVSISATVASAPLMALYFGLNSLVAPLTNLLALWSVLASFLGGILVTALSFLSMPAAVAAGKALHLLYEYLLLVLSACSRLPCGAVYTSQRYLLLWSLLWYGLLTCMLCRPKRAYLPAALALASLALCLCLYSRERVKNGFTALDVGQGQSLVATYDGSTYLIDCGGRQDDSGETAARYLLGSGISSVDGLILTHFDADHCNGVLQLMQRLPVSALYYPSRSEDSPVRRQILSRAEHCGTACVAVDSVLELEMGQGSATVYPAFFGENENDTGLCILASAAECDILVTGDLSAEGENVLLGAYALPDLEVLVAGHHGASGSTGKAILDALSPETVLISVGDNPYGHPSEKTLERIAGFGIAAYTTKENGNLTVRW